MGQGENGGIKDRPGRVKGEIGARDRTGVKGEFEGTVGVVDCQE